MIEYWDVTDREGIPTGETYRRGAPDGPVGRFHVVAAACVVRRDADVLLTQRAAHKEFPLAWEFPGGSALAGVARGDWVVRGLCRSDADWSIHRVLCVGGHVRRVGTRIWKHYR
jgi:8-oxo-dGTP diphosphatase